MDDKSRDYRATIDQLKFVIGNSDTSPATLVIAHTRRPKGGEKPAKGRSLMHDVAGSFILTAAARTVFNLQAASDSPEDDRVIFVNSKCNDGQMAERSAWHRRNGLFAKCESMNWQDFDGQAESSRASISEKYIQEIFDLLGPELPRKEVAEKLQNRTGCGKSVAYEALEGVGRFGHLFEENKGILKWTG